MLDYKLLQALVAVVEQGGFERGAALLGLSQSAISQRIKLLEARVGQPVLIRSTPPTTTDLGRRLLNHVQQVRLLERDLRAVVPALEEPAPERIRIAINADSVATWWVAAVAEFCIEQNVLLDLVVEDQDVGLNRMKAGEVAACLCASERPIAGARSVPVGAMRYLGLASPAFIARHFESGVDAIALGRAPAIVFGPDDYLQHRYIASLGGAGAFPYHLCPSSEGFVRMVCAGLGWGLLPEMQVKDEMRGGALRELVAGHVVDVPLYWHHWRNGGALLELLGKRLMDTRQGDLRG
ncbi:LysR family transcriptional regulator ArgP [Pseudomonas matsuisoli]|nr:LysR family transcriptional regulator ArgP [Pseudomonas matsuisoli]